MKLKVFMKEFIRILFLFLPDDFLHTNNNKTTKIILFDYPD